MRVGTDVQSGEALPGRTLVIWAGAIVGWQEGDRIHYWKLQVKHWWTGGKKGS